jgi:hypothetical protein
MLVFIPSLSRAGKVMPLQWYPDATLVVDSSEIEVYRREYKKTEILGMAMPGIGYLRQKLLDMCRASGDKFVMVDDDLRFYVRRDLDDWHLSKCKQEDVDEMTAAVDQALDHYPEVSVSVRQGQNAFGSEPRENQRVLRFIALNPELIPEDVRFDRMTVMEDFDFQLQLLRRGLRTLTFYRWAQDQTQTQAAGGCSVYRDHSRQDEAAKMLAAAHPGFVRLVMKSNSTGGAFGVRTDVHISWQKAFESSQQQEQA